MTDVRLNLINRSNDQNNSEIVIFSKNASANFDEMAVAWQVIKNMGQGDHHPFIYPQVTEIAAADSWGNYTPQFPAKYGERFSMIKDHSGDVLRRDASPASSPNEFELVNELQKGAIDALVYKGGKLYAEKRVIAPGEKAVFSFKPTIWIGVVSQVVEGEVMNSAIISDINTEISLEGLASADIVMTGGGPGAGATPFQFNLENTVMA